MTEDEKRLLKKRGEGVLMPRLDKMTPEELDAHNKYVIDAYINKNPYWQAEQTRKTPAKPDAEQHKIKGNETKLPNKSGLSPENPVLEKYKAHCEANKDKVRAQISGQQETQNHNRER